MEEKVIATGNVKVSIIEKSFNNDKDEAISYSRVRFHGKNLNLNVKLEEADFYSAIALLLNELNNSPSTTNLNFKKPTE